MGHPAKQSTVRQAILDALADGHWRTAPDIGRKARSPGRSMLQALSKMAEAGQIERQGERGSYRYRLRPTSPAAEPATPAPVPTKAIAERSPSKDARLYDIIVQQLLPAIEAVMSRLDALEQRMSTFSTSIEEPKINTAPIERELADIKGKLGRLASASDLDAMRLRIVSLERGARPGSTTVIPTRGNGGFVKPQISGPVIARRTGLEEDA